MQMPTGPNEDGGTKTLQRIAAPVDDLQRLECLGACIVILPEAVKVPPGPWNRRSPRGYLPYWDQILYTRLLFDLW